MVFIIQDTYIRYVKLHDFFRKSELFSPDETLQRKKDTCIFVEVQFHNFRQFILNKSHLTVTVSEWIVLQFSFARKSPQTRPNNSFGISSDERVS